MRRGEVDVRVVGVVDAAALAVRVVCKGHLLEVAGKPGEDADDEDDAYQDEEDYNAAAVSALPLFDCIEPYLLGTIGSLRRT